MESTPVAAAIAEFRLALAGLQDAVGAELWRSLDGEVGELIEAAHACEARLKAVTLVLVAEFADRGVPVAIGAVSTRAWLRDRLRETVGASGQTARMAVACSGKGPYPEVGAGLADGTLNWDQAQTIVRALEKLPAKTTIEQREFARRLLLAKAAELNADDLRTIGKGLREAADPDGSLPEDEEIERNRGVQFKDHHDGTHSIVWRDRIENVGLAKAAIAALDKPVPRQNGAADPRSAPARRADAMVRIFGGLLDHGDLPNSRGRAPHLHLTVSLDALKGGTGRPSPPSPPAARSPPPPSGAWPATRRSPRSCSTPRASPSPSGAASGPGPPRSGTRSSPATPAAPSRPATSPPPGAAGIISATGPSIWAPPSSTTGCSSASSITSSFTTAAGMSDSTNTASPSSFHLLGWIRLKSPAATTTGNSNATF